MIVSNTWDTDLIRLARYPDDFIKEYRALLVSFTAGMDRYNYIEDSARKKNLEESLIEQAVELKAMDNLFIELDFPLDDPLKQIGRFDYDPEKLFKKFVWHNEDYSIIIFRDKTHVGLTFNQARIVEYCYNEFDYGQEFNSRLVMEFLHKDYKHMAEQFSTAFTENKKPLQIKARNELFIKIKGHVSFYTLNPDYPKN